MLFRSFKDFADHPDFAQIWVKRGMVFSKVFDAPTAQADVQYKDLAPAKRECDLFDVALAAQTRKPEDVFMTAASPGIVCTTLRNAWYDSHEAYVRWAGKPPALACAGHATCVATKPPIQRP